MKRRIFLQSGSLIGLGIWLPILGCQNGQEHTEISSSEFQQLADKLLKDWCDGMLRVQINQPEDSTIHGALDCLACNKIHGRCMDAVYPFMYLADKTGEQKYLDAAIAVMDWSENVSMPDGSWTVIPDPKSWRGISVFGAIALGEALHHHGHVLPKEIYQKWKERLAKVGDYIYQNFDLTFTNINYGFTAIYALHLLGDILENPTYVERSRALAKGIKTWLSQPNYLIFGEAKPSNKRSAKGLLGVDLGYNVEETLNGVVQYARLEKDEELLALLTKSLEGHLQFMLPDGAWDNSWGTRQYKWSYWGSRTTDGCQPAFALMADRNPAFGTAAFLNTQLLERCTADGLLHGGIHYTSHGIKPCVHHTFAHAKALATIMNEADALSGINGQSPPIPRSVADGVKAFPEVSVYLAARADWLATVSSYDLIYKEKCLHGTGGALNVLYHKKVGPLFTASMAKYQLVEKNNQQPQPGEEFALTPRLETFVDGRWYTNLYDLKAKVAHSDQAGEIQFVAQVSLVDEDQVALKDQQLNFEISYLIKQEQVTIRCKNKNTEHPNQPIRLVLPLISPTGEVFRQATPSSINVQKPNGIVKIDANVPLQIKPMEQERIFNMVPGMEVLPIIMELPESPSEILECNISVD